MGSASHSIHRLVGWAFYFSEGSADVKPTGARAWHGEGITGSLLAASHTEAVSHTRPLGQCVAIIPS